MNITLRLFAALRLEAGSDSLLIQLPEGATVGDALEQIQGEYAGLVPHLPACRAAVGNEFVEAGTKLKEGDVLALIPPVQGGSSAPQRMVRVVVLTDKPPLEALKIIYDDSDPPPETGAGAVVEFRGVVRGTENDQPIEGIEYESYLDMAEHQIHRILDDLEQRLPLIRFIVIHTIGMVPAGETSLYIRVESSHRREAFVACQSFIDQLKRDVPIWKHPRSGA
ncbi:MAG: molybdenum cofactor biosynthesis protein MoaE [Candidatus Eisenbacteria bacterium]|uniref:Molybdenum cofactor biosynthesis protein MoaE n=1 Tax=Eiseniibacteriota bacterium TaxID=2212470 RepID=A0A948RVI4_UNCEI|nr:molybdenum cofactor biosynthesis protein MoaE [Candidatus Eisenbacteria bacterium]MBU2691635.1 molybdenum cofactor biosynthesis protein MoaE [Candidatus Eisenbacteria bacterium]